MSNNPQGSVDLGSAHASIRMDATQFKQGVDQAKRALDNGISGMASSLQSLGQGISNVGAQLTMMTAPLAAFGAVGVRSVAKYDDLLTQISARTGLTGDSLAQLGDFAQKEGARTIFATDEVLEAFLDLLTSGQSIEEAFDTLPTVLDAAAAGNMELGSAADAVTDILAQYQLGVEDAESVTNSLARAASSSSALFPQLVDGFANVGPIAAQFGLSVDDTAAILATFSENGIKGAEAGTQLRSMLIAMSRNTPGVKEAWDELGTSLYDSEGNMRDLNTVIEELDTALSALPMEDQNRLSQALAGSYGIIGLNTLRAAGGYDAMQESMAEKNDAATVAAIMMGSLTNMVNSLRGSIETLLITALEPMLDDIKALIGTESTGLIGFVNGLTTWAKANPEVTTQVVKFLAVLTAAGPILLIVGQMVQFAAAAAGGVGIAFSVLTGPIGLVIAGLVGLGIAYRTNFLGFRDAVQAGAVIVGAALNRMGAYFQALWQQAEPSLTALATWFTATALPAIVMFIQTIVIPALNSFLGILQGAWAFVSPALIALTGWFLMTGLPLITAFVTGPATAAMTGLFNILAESWERIHPALDALHNWVTVTGGPAVLAFWNTLKQVVEDTIGFVIGRVEDAIRTLEQLQQIAAAPRERAQAGIGGLRGIGAGLRTGQFTAGDVFRATQQEFGGNRDSGGGGRAGVVYGIGKAVDAETFVRPEARGEFFANIDKVMAAAGQLAGQTVNNDQRTVNEINITLQANSETQGREGMRGVMDELVRRGLA